MQRLRMLTTSVWRNVAEILAHVSFMASFNVGREMQNNLRFCEVVELQWCKEFQWVQIRGLDWSVHQIASLGLKNMSRVAFPGKDKLPVLEA